MKKMLVKAVALSLVLGGVGFVANNAQAADISDGVKVFSGLDLGLGFGHDVKTEKVLEKDTALANQKDLVKVNEEVATNKANITKNAENISDNKVAIMKEAAAREAEISMVKDDIKANSDAIKANGEAIKTKADAWDTAKKFAKVQEMFDNQDSKNAELDKKNGEQDAAIEVNGAAIKANKDAIKANADAIAANKADADEQHKYLNSRIEHNTACIDKNKVAIENETQARVDADNQLRTDLNQETIDRVDADNRLQTAIDQKADKTTVAENTAAIESNKAAIAQEKKDRDHADQKLQDQITINKGQIENEATNRANEDKKLNAKIDAETDARKDADNALRTDLNQETIDRVDADNRLQTAIDQKADKTTVAENTAAIESNKAAIAQEKKDRDHADQKLQDQITINKGQIENEATNRANEDKRIEAKFDGEVSRLDGRIDKLNDNVQKVGAMAAAIANLHTMGYDPEAPTEIAVGVGQYRDKTGLALGAFHYPNRDFMLSFNVSTAGDEFMGGIGATWRFGRKSPEELRQAEVEKAAKAKLAKAEAAKKAAKDARVAAQQKRHAEMLAARTGK